MIRIAAKPGIPNIPTVKAVISLTPMWTPVNWPKKLKIIINSPPNNELINILPINFKGLTKIHENINMSMMPAE